MRRCDPTGEIAKHPTEEEPQWFLLGEYDPPWSRPPNLLLGGPCTDVSLRSGGSDRCTRRVYWDKTLQTTQQRLPEKPGIGERQGLQSPEESMEQKTKERPLNEEEKCPLSYAST